ncbi:DUF998 domain-containing protein [Streptomyces albipurpureus]|uniref:DUF998 domain-containing protein n=1 Tax=Streptomyces albipurpureus TaxID=2897419 RepID=A0ABT0UNW9_9ACTN|nr:DUF998 domain-containing protein [Streptomyces sp. CWNU-1]MCM2390307.1 DUF998 domain-containing protein [Streptomyces sp. CWNU-1]
MTHTLTAPISSAQAAAPAARRTRRLVFAGAAAGPLFLGVGLIQGLTRDGFDFTRNAISQLSIGDLGWIQMTSFALTGALVIAGAIGMRRTLRDGPAGTWAPWLVGVFGLSFLVSAVFPADAGAGFPADAAEAPAASISTDGAIHMLGGMVGFLALCAAFLVLARHFAAQQERGWALACRLMPVAVLAGFMASAASVLAFTAGAGLGLIWLTATAVRLAAGPRQSSPNDGRSPRS